jgi:hypothetical protein
MVADSYNQRVMIWNSRPTAIDQPATVVLGKSSFAIGGGMPMGRSSLSYPTGVESDGIRIVVGDTGNHRVLIWNSIPGAGSHGAPADRILGQPEFATRLPNNGGVTERSLFCKFLLNAGPAVVSGPTTQIWFSDANNGRVLRYDLSP